MKKKLRITLVSILVFVNANSQRDDEMIKIPDNRFNKLLLKRHRIDPNGDRIMEIAFEKIMDCRFNEKIGMKILPFQIRDLSKTITKKEEVIFYPNPASDKLFIKGVSDIHSITATSMENKKVVNLEVVHAKCSIKKADVSVLKEGSYIIKVVSSKGTYSHLSLIRM